MTPISSTLPVTQAPPVSLPLWKRLYRRIERAIVPVVLLIGWEIFSRSGVLPPALLPAPSQVLIAWADWVFATDGNTQTYSGHWILDVAASASRVFTGFAISTLLGVGIGMAIGWSRTVERLIEPVLQVLRPVPPVSWIPLAIIWFGIADKPAIFLVFLGSFFPILLSTIHGVKSCDRNLLRAGAMTGGTPRKLLRYIVFPAALPSIFSGLRRGLGLDADRHRGDGGGEERCRLRALGFLLLPALRHRDRGHGQHRPAGLPERPRHQADRRARAALAARLHAAGQGEVT
jgi:NitT/TauT family transport system permease protein